MINCKIDCQKSVSENWSASAKKPQTLCPKFSSILYSIYLSFRKTTSGMETMLSVRHSTFSPIRCFNLHASFLVHVRDCTSEQNGGNFWRGRIRDKSIMGRGIEPMNPRCIASPRTYRRPCSIGNCDEEEASDTTSYVSVSLFLRMRWTFFEKPTGGDGVLTSLLRTRKPPLSSPPHRSTYADPRLLVESIIRGFNRDRARSRVARAQPGQIRDFSAELRSLRCISWSVLNESGW